MMFVVKAKPTFLVLTFFSLFVSSISASPIQELLEAIKKGDPIKAQEAIVQGADINFHNNVSVQNHSLTDWTPLMKSVGRLSSLIADSQSIINTYYNLSKSLAIGSTSVAGAVSLLLESPLAVLVTAGISGAATLSASRVIMAQYREAIDNQYEIVQLLLDQPYLNKEYVSHNGMSAASICRDCYRLLSSSVFSPPYATCTPEKEYITMLESIRSKLPVANNSASAAAAATTSSALYEQNVEFEKIDRSGKLPIVYHPGYTVSMGGVEKLHPFDMQKYRKIAEALIQRDRLSMEQFSTPSRVSDEDLLLVHTKEYIDSLNSSFTLGLIADMPYLGLLPNRVAQNGFLEPVKLGTGGTILGTKLASGYGWAINLAGGYHHAKANEKVVGGFSFVNDVCIAIKKMLLEHGDHRVLIVDLDAHQGNGNEELAEGENNIAIFDMYNGDTWPGDFACQERINFRHALKAKTGDGEYLRILTSNLPAAIDSTRPNLVIYIAGTDIYEQDPIGALSITREGIIKRDEIVFGEVMSRKIPILMVLAGGYHGHSREIVSASIENLWDKFLKDTIE